MTHSTTRFGDRVADYVRARPDYPAGVFEQLRDHCGLGHESRVADVGSGTGIFTSQLLAGGARVWGIEPNAPMRAAADSLLADHPRFTSVDGTAEATNLDDASVDLVTAAQAFHWFDPAAFAAECRRILVPGGQVALVWNEREIDTTPFLREYEQLLREHAVDYDEVDHRNVQGDGLHTFFAGGKHGTATFPHEQRFDRATFLARVMSSSYVPGEDDPRSEQFLALVDGLFDRHADDSHVTWHYTTTLYWGSPSGS